MAVEKIKDKLYKVVSTVPLDPTAQGRIDDINTVVNALEQHIQVTSMPSSSGAVAVAKQKAEVNVATIRGMDDRIQQFFNGFTTEEERDYVKARAYQVLYAEGLRITKVNSELLSLEKRALSAQKRDRP